MLFIRQYLVQHQDALIGLWVCFNAEVSVIVATDDIKNSFPVVCALLVQVLSLESHHLHTLRVLFNAALVLQVKCIMSLHWQDSVMYFLF